MAGVDAGTIYSEVRVALDKLKGDLQQVEAQFNKFGTTNKTAATKTEQSWKKSFGQVNLAGVAAFVAIGAAVKQAISVFASFEQSMANVQSVARATPADFKLLEDAALKAGETTRFTARQAADALYYLASAGYDAKQSTEALGGVLAYAAATQSDLAFASSQVAATISQFNLEATDAERVANVFTATIQRTQANAEKLAEAMKYIGPVANGMGISLEEVSAALGVLYNQGFLGQQAGAALRNILGDLANETGPVVKKLKDLGIAFGKINPETNSLADVIGELGKASLSTGEIIAIFGARAGPIMASLLNQGADAVRDLTAAVTDTNAAAEAMAVQNDTLQGSIDIFNSAIESASIKTVKEFTPALRGIIDAGKDVVTWLANLPAPLKIFFGIAAGGIVAVLGLATAIKILAGALAGSAGIISLVVAGIAATVAIITAIATAADTSKVALDHLTEATKKYREQDEELNKINKELTDSTKKLNDEERRTLEQRKKLAEKDLFYTLADQVKALNETKDALKGVNSDLEKQQKLYDYLDEQLQKAEGTQRDWKDNALQQSKVWQDVFGVVGPGFADWSDLMKQVGDKISSTTTRQKELNEANKSGIDVLAESLLAGNIQESQLLRLDKTIGRLIITRAVELRTIQEKEAVEKKAAEEKRKREEEAQKKRDEAERAYNQQVELVNKTLESQKTTLDKLRETLKKLESQRLKGKDEVNRQQAILVIKKQIHEQEVKLAKQEEKNRSIAEDYQNKLRDIGKTQLELIEIERQRAIESAKSSEKESGARNEAIAAINEYYDAIVENEKKKQAEESFKGVWDFAISTAQTAASSLIGLFTAIANARIAEIDRQLQAELEAAGVAEETATEKAQHDLEVAQASGDAETILEKEKALKKAQIEEAYAKKKAKIEYDSAVAAWGLQIFSAIAQAAQATLAAYSSAAAIPIIGIGLAPVAAVIAAAFGALQVAAVVAAKPQPPTFETGGIVLGPAGTDQVHARLTAGEMVLNEAQQAALWDMITGRGRGRATTGGGQRITIPITNTLDGRKISETVVEYINGNITVLE